MMLVYNESLELCSFDVEGTTLSTQVVLHQFVHECVFEASASHSHTQSMNQIEGEGLIPY